MIVWTAGASFSLFVYCLLHFFVLPSIEKPLSGLYVISSLDFKKEKLAISNGDMRRRVRKLASRNVFVSKTSTHIVSYGWVEKLGGKEER